MPVLVLRNKRDAHDVAVCLEIYLIADRPLAVRKSGDVTVVEVTRRNWARKAIGGENLYHLGPGCYCDLIDDEPAGDHVDRRCGRLDAIEAYLRVVGEKASVHALICWGGDEGHEPAAVSVPADGFRYLDFASAWDRPILASIIKQ